MGKPQVLSVAATCVYDVKVRLLPQHARMVKSADTADLKWLFDVLALKVFESPRVVKPA